MKKKILGIIPARSGSKGIKNKNITKINGKPLISYTIKSALESKLLSDVIVSTDSIKIKKIALKYGAKVPFLRPKKLATDTSNIIDTIKFCLKKMENKFQYDYVILLQPTSPLRKFNEIDKSIKKILFMKYDSLISLTKVEEPHPIKLKRIIDKNVYSYLKSNKKDNPPRQLLPEVFKPSGNIYITKRNIIVKKNKILGPKTTYIIIDEKNFLNIDTKADLIDAQRKLKK